MHNILTAFMREIDIIVEKRLNDKLEEIKKVFLKKQQPLLNAQEAANYLNMSVKSVYRYVQLGKLSYYKPAQINYNSGKTSGKNTKIFFKLEELNNYLLNEDNHYHSDEEICKLAQSKLIKFNNQNK